VITASFHRLPACNRLGHTDEPLHRPSAMARLTHCGISILQHHRPGTEPALCCLRNIGLFQMNTKVRQQFAPHTTNHVPRSCRPDMRYTLRSCQQYAAASAFTLQHAIIDAIGRSEAALLFCPESTLTGALASCWLRLCRRCWRTAAIGPLTSSSGCSRLSGVWRCFASTPQTSRCGTAFALRTAKRFPMYTG
jgi:hypothetical protein